MTIDSNNTDRFQDLPTHTDSTNSYIDIGYHKFFIPVMGTGFTIDTPLRVAKYGISSVISIGDDILIEQMREHYSDVFDKPYRHIPKSEEDSRVKRIRSYLNLVHDLVQNQMQAVCSSPFETGSDITRYFEMMPSGTLKSAYDSMIACTHHETKLRLQSELRQKVVAGNIDVNIMTKVDRELRQENGKGVPESGIAMSALCGFATSELRSSIVLSAGINKRLFAYMAQFDDFFPTADKPPQKTIILKVSDYRSALLQGTLLAKRGLWVSEYRIESGLNCGGHAFATKGELLGPVLNEFQANRASLVSGLRKYYYEALDKLGKVPSGDPSIILSAQGGVGTSEEQSFLFSQYHVDRVGWGTPFLLVPEATNVDSIHLQKLSAATEDDVELSDASPLGIPFWLLKNTTSDEYRRKRIAENTPGSECLKQFLATDLELSSTPVCKASMQYQRLKLKQLNASSLPTKQKQAAISSVLSKTCLCMDLAGSVLNRLNLDTKSHTAVCSGLSITDFNRVYTLKEMVDHIYGRLPIKLRKERPHMFIRELSLYITYLKNQLIKNSLNISSLSDKYFNDFSNQLLNGIKYYRQMASQLKNGEQATFLFSLADLEKKVQSLISNLDALQLDHNGSLLEATSILPA
ncbi:MAG: hypothetical protein KKG33_05400 [candidate division Zixibacteria bacterium]|nr:hypothetical protein [candidate division Zixibacteria bacterium]MBU1469769.1 hypothetical protein [candidate division Zixibacteria bacterium]MBU2624977.1 hypothetical protein [candidate division Zixibacteria bacterium]